MFRYRGLSFLDGHYLEVALFSGTAREPSVLTAQCLQTVRPFWALEIQRRSFEKGVRMLGPDSLFRPVFFLVNIFDGTEIDRFLNQKAVFN